MANGTSATDYFRAWQRRDWDFVESHLAPGFTFTTQYDDHIDATKYRQKCWDAVTEIGEYDFIKVVEDEAEAIVEYRGRINGTDVHNIEHLRFEGGKLKAVEVFFGRP